LDAKGQEENKGNGPDLDAKGQEENKGNGPDLDAKGQGAIGPDLDAKGQKAKDPFAPNPETVARLAQLRAEAPPTKCTSCGGTDLTHAHNSLNGDAVRTECAQCFAALSDVLPPEPLKKKSKRRAKNSADGEPYTVAPKVADESDGDLI
jgi:hypothetical protein